MSEDKRFAYIGIKPCCGKAVAVVVDDPQQYIHTAEIIVGWGKHKLTVQRVPVSYAKTALARCTCKTEGRPNYAARKRI